MRMVFLLFLILTGSTGVFAAPSNDIPVYTQPVMDLAGIFDASVRKKVNGALLQLKKSGGPQIGVLTIPTLGGENLEAFSIRVAETWKLGDKEKDDGLVFILVPKDRVIRIEVGYGLEGVIPDIKAKEIIDSHIVPRFKNGDFSGGLFAGLEAAVKLVKPGYPLGLTQPAVVETPEAAAVREYERLRRIILRAFRPPPMTEPIVDLAGVIDDKDEAVFNKEIEKLEWSGPNHLQITLAKPSQILDDFARETGKLVFSDVVGHFYSPRERGRYAGGLAILVDVENGDCAIQETGAFISYRYRAKASFDPIKARFKAGDAAGGVREALALMKTLEKSESFYDRLKLSLDDSLHDVKRFWKRFWKNTFPVVLVFGVFGFILLILVGSIWRAISGKTPPGIFGWFALGGKSSGRDDDSSGGSSSSGSSSSGSSDRGGGGSYGGGGSSGKY